MADDGGITPSVTQKPYGMIVVVVGILAVAVVTGIAIFHYGTATQVVTALGPVTGIIGTLVGAYFGLRGASIAQQKANEAEVERRKAGPSAHH